MNPDSAEYRQIINNDEDKAMVTPSTVAAMLQAMRRPAISTNEPTVIVDPSATVVDTVVADTTDYLSHLDTFYSNHRAAAKTTDAHNGATMERFAGPQEAASMLAQLEDRRPVEASRGKFRNIFRSVLDVVKRAIA